MIDPLTAFSTAASALQFAEFAVKLIRKSIEYSSGGGSREYQVLQDLIQQMTVSNAHLQTSLDRSQSASRISGPARALYLANEECLKISQEVYQLLDGLKLNRSCTIWRSVKLALKALTTKEKFQSLNEQLKHARANLTLSLMVYLQDQTTSDREAHQAGHESLCRDVRTVTAQARGMVSNIADLATKFEDVHIGDTTLTRQWEDAIRKDSLYLQTVSKDIMDVATKLDNESTNMHEQLKQLLPVMNIEVLARRKILDSLFFSKMHSRRHRVARAHKSTYQWLFKHKEDHHIVWHDFVDWLCHDDQQSIYWISGKPGSGKTTLVRELDGHVVHKSTLGASDIVFPQQEGSEWLKLKADMKKDMSLHLTSTELRNASLHETAKPPPEYSIHEQLVLPNERVTLQNEQSLLPDLQSLEDGQSVLQNELTTWVGQGNLLTASRYFWYAGSVEEQSIRGLIQGLTHQLLSQRPDLIDKVVPNGMWYSACCQDNIGIHWEEIDLITTLQNIGRCTQRDDKILLLIDGLDECHGTHDQQEHLLSLIKDLTKMDHIKACVASRPWNVFRDAFRNCPQLRLEDLTKSDIERYIIDKLGEDHYFQQEERTNAILLSEVSQSITDRARGVFLWVRLVVRDLLRFLRDGGRPSSLSRELDRIPQDLDQYFKRMIGDIESSYQKDAAMILLAALRNMDFPRGDGGLASGPDLLLIHLDYLVEEGSICIADEENIDSTFDLTKSDVLDRLDRRLASRCMGLLEIDTYPLNNVGDAGNGEYVIDDTGIYRFQNTSAGGRSFRPERWTPQNARIEFLHRTVRDFLTLESPQQMLRDFAGDSFDPHWFRCNMLVLDAASFRKIGRSDLWVRATVCFFRQILDRPCSEDTFKLYERMVAVLSEELLSRTSGVGYAYRDPAQSYRSLAEAIIDWSDHQSTALSLAIQLGWKPYILSRLTRELVQEKRGRPLLDYALRPCYHQSQKSDLEIIQEILRLGGQPDAPPLVWTQVPTWVYYFQSLQYQDILDSASSQTIIRALLHSGIHKHVSKPELLSVHRDLCRRPLLDERKLNFGISILRSEGSEMNRHAERAVSNRLLEPLHQRSEDDEGRYSALDVLRSLIILTGPVQGRALFTPDEVARLESSSHKRSRDEQFQDEGAREGCQRHGPTSPNEYEFVAKRHRVHSWDSYPKRAW